MTPGEEEEMRYASPAPDLDSAKSKQPPRNDIRRTGEDIAQDQTTIDLIPNSQIAPMPRHWGHLQIIELAGRGAYGDVYRAWDPKLQREIALKLLRRPDCHQSDPDLADIREARLLARVRHPNVLTVYGVDCHEGRMGLSTEFIRGRTLADLIRAQGPLGPREAILIGLDLCAGVAAVHEKGLVHRDIKAENVMREEGGRILLMDFGVGQECGGEARQEQLYGTPVYMAPETLCGEKTTRQSDIYSLGVLLYFLVTGSFPVEGKNLKDLRNAHERRYCKLLRDRRPDLPGRFVQVVEQATSQEPAARFSSAGQMAQALSAALGTTEATRGQEGLAWRKIWVVSRAAVLLMLMGLLFLPVSWRSSEPKRVLIADFDNHTDYPDVELTFRELVTLSLGQSSSFDVFSRSRMLDTLPLLRLPRATRMNVPVAEQIALRENVHVVIGGAIGSQGTGYQMVMMATHPKSERTLAAVEKTIKSRDELPRAVDLMVTELRSKLGERRDEIAQNSAPLEQVTTNSFEALVLYTQALDFQAHVKLEEAIACLKSAIQKDPEFATAHRLLATMYSSIGKFEESLEAATRAYALRERTTERERLLIDGIYHVRRADFEKGLESYRMVTILSPKDVTAHYQVAQLQVFLGDLNPAIDSIKRAVELSPESLFHRGMLSVLLAQANREDEALQEIRAARARPVQGQYLYWGDGLAWLGKGEYARAREAFGLMAKGGGIFESRGRLYQAQALVLEGRLMEAAYQLEADQWTHTKAANTETEARGRDWLTRLYLLHGDKDRALEQLSSLGAQAASPANLSALRSAGLLYAQMGKLDRAEGVLRKLRELSLRYPSRYTRGIEAQVQGELDRVAGRAEAARRNLENARASWADVSVLYSVALFWVTQQEHGRAFPLYQEVLARKGTSLHQESAVIWVLAHLDAARCLRNLGNSREAGRYYDQFLRFWEGDASKLPLVAEAKRERESLPKEK